MTVHCQRVLRADVPTVNRFKGASSSKKVTQDNLIVRKIGKGPTINTRYLPSLPWDLRTCVNVEPGYFKSRSWARFSVSDWTCCALAFGVMARDAKVLNSTKVSQSEVFHVVLQRKRSDIPHALRQSCSVKATWKVHLIQVVSVRLLPESFSTNMNPIGNQWWNFE